VQRVTIELVSAGFDGFGHGHDEAAVAPERPARVDEREPDDAARTGFEVQHVALGGLFGLGVVGRVCWPSFQCMKMAMP
jgi:hypothetical protein